MNQKRITNQILKQRNYTLNSTLNYLFNISNMKKLFSYLLISSMVVLSSCTNYDDQFDDLNTQINSLKSQIEGFSSLSSGLTSLQGTVASLQSAVASLPQTATPATDISGLEASVAELQAALAGAATNAQVAAITADLAATQTALEASIAAASTPATDISGLEASVAELETALAAASTSEEVSAISTELAAAQTALAAAIEANATAASDNATDIAALATSLEALTTTIAELQASLATVSTAAEVTALADSLAAAQADLTAILASSSFYAQALQIKTQAQLDFAVSLGDKVKFLNSTLEIEQTATMDATQLASVMAKILNVTGKITYTSTVTSTTKGAFSSLTGAGEIAFSQDGDISLPKLESVTGAMSITGTSNTETVSLPVLTKVTGVMSFNSLTSATTFSMPTMVAHDNAVEINIANAGTVDLSAFTNATTQAGLAATTFEDLTVNAAVLTAPLYAAGKITADRLTNVTYPNWAFDNGSSFKRAETVVLAGVNRKKLEAITIDIKARFPKASSVHLISAASTATTPTHNSVTAGGSDNLATLILGGTWNSVTVNGSDMDSLTFDGTAKSVSVTGTDIVNLDIPYTSAAKGSLSITNNLDLESVTASKVNGLSGLTITGNTELSTLSFAALKTAGASPRVAVSNNDLTIDNIQEANTTPAVAFKISSADFAEISTYLGAAADLVVKKDDSVVATADNVTKITSGTGTVNDSVDLTAKIYKSYAGAAANDVLPTVIVNKVFTAAESYGGVTGAAAKFDILITSQVDAAGAVVTVGGETVSVIPKTALQLYYDVFNWSNNSATTNALSNAGVKIAKVGRGQNTAKFTIKSLTGAVSAVLTLDPGVSSAVSVTTGSASTIYEIEDAFDTALTAGQGVVSKYYSIAGSGTTESVITFTRLNRGSAQTPFDISFTAKALSGTVASSTSMYFSPTASFVSGDNLASSDSAYVTFEALATGSAGAKTVTMTGVLATQLTASGVNVGTDANNWIGDDENVTETVTGSDPTSNNAVAVAQASVDYTAAVSAS